ncbi:alkaline phosphatase family protein [uncultured Sunxiuqinia sp.]|uniref:alkaline phosphatase family protein n=1 Tax=uncultured Sunxiuqinia sp. TaxID=1573825 RepID=UPI00263769B5|nr:alkaline phosphatase family protein [uncultured Sunxiuqinia sp.]
MMSIKKVFLTVVFAWMVFFTIQAKTRKVVYIVLDGIPADYVERVRPKTVFDIADKGAYARAYTGGEIGGYSQTPTISAVGYTNILTGTWLNKHNVPGNSNLKPNYNYWSIFRIAKEQQQDFKTALFSSWVDNRTVLIGEGKEETNQLQIDYVYDGYELDKTRFPEKKDHKQIFEIDSVVCQKAAASIRRDAPDLSWVYLWYTDSGFHLYGDGAFMDDYVNKTDQLIAQIWEAVQYREKMFDEDWLVIVTTDHGRSESGHGHGGQSERERSVWISTNQKKVNNHFGSASLSLVDILPTICHFMDFDVPRDLAFEQDGISFLGKNDISALKTSPYDDTVVLSWNSSSTNNKAIIYMATTNHFKEGGVEEWIELGEVPAKAGAFTVDISQYPASKFYKFVVSTPHNALNRWLRK